MRPCSNWILPKLTMYVVSWAFLSFVMQHIGIPDSFTHIVLMLFKDALDTILFNGKPTNPFLSNAVFARIAL